jgi:hypothetical protein
MSWLVSANSTTGVPPAWKGSVSAGSFSPKVEHFNRKTTATRSSNGDPIRNFIINRL